MCTIGAVFSKKTAYVFKNRDLTKPTIGALPEIRTGKYKYIAFPRPRGGIWFGVNEYGIALTASDAHFIKKYPPQRNAGDKITAIYEDIIANSSTLGKAEKIVVDSFRKKIKVPDILIISDSKRASAYEYTPEKQAIQKATKSSILRANSFLVLKGAPDRKNDPSSYLRYKRIKELLSGKISLAKIKAALANHKNGPGENSICRHGRKKGEYTTQYSAIAEIAEKKIKVYYMANKKPCEGKWKSIEIQREIKSYPSCVWLSKRVKFNNG